MTTATQKSMPRGGRRGGTVFPRLDLKQAHEYARKLVSKTHTSAQPAAIILPGVFKSKGPDGKVRASALKQFGLMEGKASAYQASQLAKDVISAPPEEVAALLQKACLTLRLFNTLFETFQSDKVSSARVRQQAINLGVHPNTADECVKTFVDSLGYAQLARTEGDAIAFGRSGEEVAHSVAAEGSEGGQLAETESNSSIEIPIRQMQDGRIPLDSASGSGRKAVPTVQVSINVDPSMDPEKLEKLLMLLKEFGAL